MAITCCLTLVLVGCVGYDADRRPDSAPRRSIQAAADLAGDFHNRGVSPSGEWQPLLSDCLFDGVTFAEPPDVIQLTGLPSGGLRCGALVAGKRVATRDLVQDKDFRLVDGGLKLADPAVEPVIGTAGVGMLSGTTVLQLTGSGDLLMTCRGGGAGLMIFVVPMVVAKNQDAVFGKLGRGVAAAGRGRD